MITQDDSSFDLSHITYMDQKCWEIEVKVWWMMSSYVCQWHLDVVRCEEVAREVTKTKMIPILGCSFSSIIIEDDNTQVL